MGRGQKCLCHDCPNVVCHCGSRTTFPKVLYLTCPATAGPPGKGDCFLAGTHELIWDNPLANYRCSANYGWSWVLDTFVDYIYPDVDIAGNLLGYITISTYALTT